MTEFVRNQNRTETIKKGHQLYQLHTYDNKKLKTLIKKKMLANRKQHQIKQHFEKIKINYFN